MLPRSLQNLEIRINLEKQGPKRPSFASARENPGPGCTVFSRASVQTACMISGRLNFKDTSMYFLGFAVNLSGTCCDNDVLRATAVAGHSNSTTFESHVKSGLASS